MVTLTPEEMAARLKRKEELLKAQGRRGKSDAKILYGAEFQMGKREVTPSSDAGTESGGSKPDGARARAQVERVLDLMDINFLRSLSIMDYSLLLGVRSVEYPVDEPPPSSGRS